MHAGTDSVVILDIPLLKEETRDQFGIVGVIVVDVALEVAVERLLDRGLSEQDARARIASQMSREERRAMAGIVVDNSGSRSDLESSVGRVWEWIEGLRSPARSGGVRAPGATGAPPASDRRAAGGWSRPTCPVAVPDSEETPLLAVFRGVHRPRAWSRWSDAGLFLALPCCIRPSSALKSRTRPAPRVKRHSW